jgi:hypothetical protein
MFRVGVTAGTVVIGALLGRVGVPAWRWSVVRGSIAASFGRI